MARPEFFLRSYPMPDDMAAHAAAVEGDGWDGLLLTDSQNLSMDVFGSLYIAAGAPPPPRRGPPRRCGSPPPSPPSPAVPPPLWRRPSRRCTTSAAVVRTSGWAAATPH